MKTIMIELNQDKVTRESLETPANIIKRGGLVAFPTETVYGLGADATNDVAVKAIFAAKGRAADNPLIVHIADPEGIFFVCKEVSEVAKQLMDAFWPGPLTLVLPKSDHISDVTSAGLDTIGVRMPVHEVARALIRASKPLAAPSANVSGKPSPTTAQHVADDLSGKIDCIIQTNTAAAYGIESTVFHVASKTLLRPGAITQAMIESVIGPIQLDPYLEKQKAYLYEDVVLEKADKPLSPGQKYKHYAPQAETLVFVVPSGGSKQAVVDKIKAHAKGQANLGILATDETLDQYVQTGAVVLSMGSAEDGYAKLFTALRAFDAQKVGKIYIEGLEETGVGFSVMDRIIKAASYHIVR